jgi:hypothetical protein
MAPAGNAPTHLITTITKPGRPLRRHWDTTQTLKKGGKLGNPDGTPGWRQPGMLTDTPSPHLSTKFEFHTCIRAGVTLCERQAGGPASFCKERLQESIQLTR